MGAAWDSLWTWIRENRELTLWLTSASVFTFLSSLILLPLVLVRMSPDYFLPERDEETSLQEKHPFLRLLIVMGKNCLGALLVLGGLMMLVLPGQGLLTILAGLLLLDFPGKRQLQRRLICRPLIFRAINRIRTRCGHPPLLMPDLTAAATEKT
jgi:hypothetical protein